ncbi:MAG: phospho-sugar mutase [Clostridia bacterium]|nr:phospho-sugar mutase [Clostridia bacterium]
MYSELLKLWETNATEDKDLITEINSIKNNPEEISDRFYKELDFGTAGLRGVIGVGTNRMNIYTVGRASQALAEYVKSVDENGSVAIAYDSRIKSFEFANAAASVIASNGIKVYIYNELMPTPMLSFAVRRLKCQAGIVITASHNPAKYNGYKAYGPDGCQLQPDAANDILKRMQKIDYFSGLEVCNFTKYLNEGKIEYISQQIIDEYLAEVKKQSFADESYNLPDLSVIYTPLHGTGNKPVREILKQIGVNNIAIVSEQELPDGNFPTAPYPNPEIKQPFELALNLTKKFKADLILATDPDCDRVGIAVLNNGEYTLMSGNDVGALLLNYILERRTQLNLMPQNPVAVKTIVTTDVCQKIADKFGCQLINVLTGFKFIGEQIALLENKAQENRFIFGYEESYGYLPAAYVRDKDAVVASMLICEMAAYYKTQGLSLLDKLASIFNEHGYYFNSQKSFSFEGQTGMQKMENIMENLRNNPPKQISQYNVIAVSDYLKSTKTDVNGNVSKIELPKSNVIEFLLDGGSKVILRPSGTEPKIKVYLIAVDNNKDLATTKLKDIENSAENLLK